jgi:hypothetical protein
MSILFHVNPRISPLRIAWQQWQINSHQLALEKYDRRLRVYTEVRKFLSLVVRTASPSLEDLLIFYRSVSEADFLFGPEIHKYINEVYEHGVNFLKFNEEYRDRTQNIPEGYDHKKVVNGRDRELRWFLKQIESAKEKFRKYLDISK